MDLKGDQTNWRQRGAHTEYLGPLMLYRHADGRTDIMGAPGKVIGIADELIRTFEAGNAGPGTQWDAEAGVLTIRAESGVLIYDVIGMDPRRNYWIAIRRDD